MANLAKNLAQEVANLVRRVDGEHLQALLESGLLSDLLAANPGAIDRIAFHTALSPKAHAEPADTFRVMVDYGLNLREMIKAGYYDSVDRAITARNFSFKARAPEVIEIRLVHLGCRATTDQVLTELEKRDLRPTTLAELLALGALHPYLQRRYWIAALGSNWLSPQGSLLRPILREGGLRRRPNVFEGWDMRYLGLAWGSPMRRWGGGWRFAAVRK